MSYVCSIHEQYVPNGKRCPYCVEPEAGPDGIYAGIDLASATSALKEVYSTVNIDVTTLAATSNRQWADIVKYWREVEESNIKRFERDLNDKLWGKP